MKKNKKIRKRFSLPLIEVIRDIRSYRKWINAIREERANPNSKFNKFELNANYFYVLYLPITLPQEDAALPDNIKRLRVVENLAPIHQYLDNDLGFADYIVPEFNQFYDEDNNPTLTYGIVYRFAFKKLSLKWVLSRTLFLAAAIFAIFKFVLV
ncbi:MAG TPA: hypothetical protein PK122_02145 [Candidatus Paceibacterota bacterium]|nr:hypothetical protein [Candidatus Paceibacterota bacterium]